VFGVSGAWRFALLQQSKQFAEGSSGECCALRDGVVRFEVGGRDRDAQAHRCAVGDEDVAGAVRRMADRQDREASPEQRVSGIRYLDLLGRRIRRVLEGGTVLPGRSTLWIMLTCGNCSGKGYATG
jgi:hypothetical protein